MVSHIWLYFWHFCPFTFSEVLSSSSHNFFSYRVLPAGTPILYQKEKCWIYSPPAALNPLLLNSSFPHLYFYCLSVTAQLSSMILLLLLQFIFFQFYFILFSIFSFFFFPSPSPHLVLNQFVHVDGVLGPDIQGYPNQDNHNLFCLFLTICRIDVQFTVSSYWFPQQLFTGFILWIDSTLGLCYFHLVGEVVWCCFHSLHIQGHERSSMNIYLILAIHPERGLCSLSMLLPENNFIICRVTDLDIKYKHWLFHCYI